MNKKGQTLLEVIISTGMISVALVAILGVVIQSFVAGAESKQRTQATFIAQDAIEKILAIRNVNAKAIKAGETIAWDLDFYTQDGYYNYGEYRVNQPLLFRFLSSSITEDDYGLGTHELDDVFFKRYIEIKKRGGSDNEREVNVKVTWPAADGIGEVHLSTVITKFPFQPSAIIDPNWFTGVAGTPLEGKFVYKEDLYPTGIGYWWGYWNWDCVAPYCQTGLDPGYPSDDILSYDNNVNFNDTGWNSYPARHQCKIQTGGRMPTVTELESIYWNRTSYGNNFNAWGVKDYWSANEISAGSARFIHFANVAGDEPWIQTSYKDGEAHIRCVKD